MNKMTYYKKMQKKRFEKMKYLMLILLVGLLFIAGCELPYTVQKKEEKVVKPTEQLITNLTNSTPPEIHNTLNADGSTNIIFFDNAKSVLIKSGDKSMLIDTGDRDNSLELVSKIRSFGITNLTYLVLTHQDEDSIGGANVIYLKFKPEIIYESGVPSQISSLIFIKKYRNITELKSPEIINLNSATITLTPPYFGKGFSLNMNDNTIQVQIDYSKKTMYLFGDCGKACEPANADIYQISETTTSDFIMLSEPEQIIINRKGMQEQKQILDFLEIPYKSTEQCGDILVSEKGTQTIKC